MTATDVHAAAAQLGVVVRKDEVEILKFLLAAAHDTFEEIMSLPDFVLPTDLDELPRRDVRPGNLDSELGAVWSYRATISRADSQQEEHPGDLLGGKNIVVKDNICVAGIPQSQGSDAIASWIPDADATVVTRALQAGATIVGTATCEALSCATVNNTASAGPIYNPFAKGYSAGGSPSGVASLVAKLKPVADGIDGQLEVHMGIGADQGGSIRVPAAFCGLVGLKATHGLIPYTGVTNCEAVLDHVGPICRTVWDTALLLEAIAGVDSIDDRQIGASRYKELSFSSDLLTWYSEAVAQHGSQPLQGKKIAIVQEAMNAAYMKDEMKDEVYGVSEQLQKLGAEIEVVSITWHSTGASLWMGMCRYSLLSGALGNPIGRRCYYPLELLRNTLPWDQEKWDRLPPAMRNEFINGVYEQTHYPVLYAKCMNLSLKRKF